jgi:hypothetical protein
MLNPYKESTINGIEIKNIIAVSKNFYYNKATATTEIIWVIFEN